MWLSLQPKHAAAVSDAISSTFDASSQELKVAVKEQDRKLKIAHGLLLQQSDNRWGTKITDKALYAIDQCARDFRREAD